MPKPVQVITENPRKAIANTSRRKKHRGKTAKLARTSGIPKERGKRKALKTQIQKATVTMNTENGNDEGQIELIVGDIEEVLSS